MLWAKREPRQVEVLAMNTQHSPSGKVFTRACVPEKEPEQAITYLNMATAAETEQGLEAARSEIDALIRKAMDCMEVGKARTDGNYAFVCEKCATVFGYYGYEEYARELTERCRRIYEGA